MFDSYKRKKETFIHSFLRVISNLVEVIFAQIAEVFYF